MPARHFLALSLLMASACAPVGPGMTAIAPASLPAPGDPLALPDGYARVWSDDFDGSAEPSPRRWHYETSRNAKRWFNGEQQYYARDRRENARIEHGRLVIEARVERLPADRYPDWSGQEYTSARLTTRGSASWRYGYFVVRAKLPCVRGAWPAIWLLPEHQDMRWQGGEIDLAETVGYEPHTVHHSIQTADRNFTRKNQIENGSSVDYCGSFHDYQLLWTADRIVMGVDGRVGFATDKVADFDRKMALILNVAVGGEWAAAQGIDVAGFPARMDVESIEVWQRRMSS